LRVLQHGFEAFLGQGGIERDVGASGFEDGEDSHDHLDGSVAVESDEGVGGDAMLDEQVSELVGSLVELVVGEGVLLAGEGRRVGSGLDLLFDELMNAPIEGVGSMGVVEGIEALEVVVGEPGEAREGALGIGDDAFEQTLKLPDHPLDPIRVEEVRVVLDYAP
jgi:hypothetical protein